MWCRAEPLSILNFKSWHFGNIQYGNLQYHIVSMIIQNHTTSWGVINILYDFLEMEHQADSIYMHICPLT